MTIRDVLRVLWSYEQAKDLKPAELALEVGVDVSTIYRWKRRHQSPVGTSRTVLLAFLEREGLIVRKAGGDGRRPSSYHLAATA